MDAGAVSFDAYAGNLTDSVEVEGLSAIQTSTSYVGITFVVTYISRDAAGNAASIQRNVTILPGIMLPAASTSASSSSSIGVIVGVVLGMAVALLVVVLLVYRRRRRVSKIASLAPLMSPSAISFENPIFNDDVGWFHGCIPREAAEDRLRQAGHRNGAFLVRSRGESGTEFVISFVHGGRTLHYILDQQPSGEFVIQIEGVVVAIIKGQQMMCCFECGAARSVAVGAAAYHSGGRVGHCGERCGGRVGRPGEARRLETVNVTVGPWFVRKARDY
jgi:hypothetical protein